MDYLVVTKQDEIIASFDLGDEADKWISKNDPDGSRGYRVKTNFTVPQVTCEFEGKCNNCGNPWETFVDKNNKKFCVHCEMYAGFV